MKYFLTTLVSLVSLVSLDFVWLGVIMRSWYAEQFGALMRTPIHYGYAALFYVLYTVGVVYFCIIPYANSSDVLSVVLRGFVFGVICYMTYDLTNAATLAGFPVRIIIPDILWGGVVTAITTYIGWRIARM